LKEETVKAHVKRWLQKRWKLSLADNASNVDYVVCRLQPKPPEFRWWIYYEAVECKGSESGKGETHRAIGQCLDYFISYGGIPTYLAVPEDYQQLKTLVRVIEYFHLPIGIIVVNVKGNIMMRKKAYGKKRYTRFVGSSETGYSAESFISAKTYFKTSSLEKKPFIAERAHAPLKNGENAGKESV